MSLAGRSAEGRLLGDGHEESFMRSARWGRVLIAPRNSWGGGGDEPYVYKRNGTLQEADGRRGHRQCQHFHCDFSGPVTIRKECPYEKASKRPGGEARVIMDPATQSGSS